ncbi:MAG: hypothetical protein WBQ73_02715 [Candidatus Babeliales bacterium]
MKVLNKRVTLIGIIGGALVCALPIYGLPHQKLNKLYASADTLIKKIENHAKYNKSSEKELKELKEIVRQLNTVDFPHAQLIKQNLDMFERWNRLINKIHTLFKDEPFEFKKIDMELEDIISPSESSRMESGGYRGAKPIDDVEEEEDICGEVKTILLDVLKVWDAKHQDKKAMDEQEIIQAFADLNKEIKEAAQNAGVKPEQEKGEGIFEAWNREKKLGFIPWGQGGSITKMKGGSGGGASNELTTGGMVDEEEVD